MKKKTYQRIYQVVYNIPRSKVATYGQVARIADLGRNARMVGYALHNLPDGSDVPWHRVVNHRGRISLTHGTETAGELQRRLLEHEGIKFDISGKIDLARFGWNE